MGNLDLFIQTLVSCTTIVIVAKFSGSLMRLLHQPAVVGEMFAGVILGPTFFGAFFPEWSEKILPTRIQPILFILSNIGLSFYMFLVGMEMDITLFNRSLIKKSAKLTLAAFALPLAGGIFIASLYKNLFAGQALQSDMILRFFFGAAFAITAFPMLARILQEKGIVRTKLGSIALLSASLQDVLSWILLAFLTSLAAGKNYVGGLLSVGGAIFFLFFVWYFIRPFLKKVAATVENKNNIEASEFSWIVIALLLSAWITDSIGLYSVFGGFVLGVAVPRVPLFTEAIKVRINDIMVVFLIPLFFAYTGLNTNLSGIIDLNLLIPTLVLLIVAIITKLLPVFIIMSRAGYHPCDAVSLAALMNARGLMILIIANVGLSYNLINRDAYSVLVLLAVISTLMALPVYEWAQKHKTYS